MLAPSDTIRTLLDPWLADIDGDMFLNEYNFTRTPLVEAIKLARSSHSKWSGFYTFRQRLQYSAPV